MDQLDRLAAAAQDLTTRSGLDAALEQVPVLAAAAVDRCDVATVITADGAGPAVTKGSTHPSGSAADAAQLELGQGPYLDAAGGRASVLCHDLAADQRWPLWAPLARGHGFASVLAAPLPLTRPLVAVVLLYAASPGVFDAWEQAVTRLYTVHAGTVLSAAQDTENLRAAPRTRHTIGLASVIC